MCQSFNKSTDNNNFRINHNNFPKTSSSHDLKLFLLLLYYLIENKKIWIGRVEMIKEDLPKLVLRFADILLVNTRFPPERIGNNSEIKFSSAYQDWYDTELYDLMTPIFKKELEVLNYGF